MEIRILLAGVEMGPFSEQQVRDYLAQGLVSPLDPAKGKDMEDWTTVEVLLASLPSAAVKEETSIESASASKPRVQTVRRQLTPETSPQQTLFSTPIQEKFVTQDAAPKPRRKAAKIVIQDLLPLDATPPPTKKEPIGKKRTAQVPKPPVAEPASPTTLKVEPEVVPVPVKSPAPPRRVTVVPSQSAEKNVSIPAPVSIVPPVQEPAPVVSVVTPEPTRKITVVPPNLVEKEVPVSRPAPVVLPVQEPIGIAPVPASVPSRKRKKKTITTPLGEMQPIVIWFAAGLGFLLVSLPIAASYLTGTVPKKSTAEVPGADVPVAPAVSVQPDAVLVPESNPKTAFDFTARGNSRQAKGDVEGALADYDQAINLDPKYAPAYYGEGLARQSKSDWSGALANYNQVLSLDARHADAYSNRGLVKQSTGDLDGALADYSQALLINPKLPGAFYNRGRIKEKRGNLDEAILDYNQALDLDPKMAPAYFNRANAKNTQNNLDGAIADYTQALALDSKMPLAYSNRGFARQSKGDFSGALEDYSQALALNPKMGSVYYNRSLIKVQTNDLDGAIADSTSAIQIDPKDASSYCNRGLARMGKGDIDHAADDLITYCELAPHDDGVDSARLYLWLIAVEKNLKAHGDQDLSAVLLNDWNSPPSDMATRIAKFLLGRLAEDDLIAAANSPDPAQDAGLHCKVWYFAGMKRVLAGDKALGMEYLRKCVATGRSDLCEYTFAKAKLQELK